MTPCLFVMFSMLLFLCLLYEPAKLCSAMQNLTNLAVPSQLSLFLFVTYCSHAIFLHCLVQNDKMHVALF